jgi:DNA/RNA endonuclease YhcR with UshA esterase domain
MMRTVGFLALALFLFTLCPPGAVQATRIYDVQFNNTNRGSGNDCYPSPLVGQTVTISGIVTAVDTSAAGGKGFFVQDSVGQWCGVFVFTTTYSAAQGDSVTVTGEVQEYYGVTEVSPTSAPTIHAHGRPVPAPLAITCADLGGACSPNGESYEGLLVSFQDVVVVRDLNAYNEWSVRNVSGSPGDTCQIDDKCYYYDPNLGDTIGLLVGVVNYAYSSYDVNPRSAADIGTSAPVISNLTWDPYIPLSSEGVEARAKVLDDQGLSTVEIIYSVDGGDSYTVPMAPVVGDSIFAGDIPAQANGSLVEFRIKATDNSVPSHVSYSGLSGYFSGTTPISAVRVNDPDGKALYAGYGARVAGVATVGTGVFRTQGDGVDFYVQDNSPAGINVFDYDAADVVSEGDSLMIQGKIGQYNGKTEILLVEDVILITHLGQGTVPDYQIVTIDQMGEPYEGMLVAFQYLTKSGGTWPLPDSSENLYFVRDGGSETLQVRIDSDTDIDGQPEPTWPQDIIGIGNQYDYTSPYDSYYQLLPRYMSDFRLAGSTPVEGDPGGKPATARFELLQNSPNPFSGSTLITYSLPTPDRVSLKIYNVNGELVRILKNGVEPRGVMVATWNGHTDRGTRAAPGVYMYALESGAKRAVRSLVILR